MPSRIPIPAVILVGGMRLAYYSRVLSELIRVNRDADRLIFAVGENASGATAAIEMVPKNDTKLCVIDIVLGSDALELTGPLRLKHIWYAVLRAVWESHYLLNYSGNIVFLEDDVVPAPDFFHALDFACGVKDSRKNMFQLVAMGGWGGENQINADPKTFAMKLSAAFPTMGYAFDRALWVELLRVRESFLRNVDNTDWAECVARELCIKAKIRNFPVELSSFHRCGHIHVIQPTLSRVWHVGRTSQVGSVHESSYYQWPTVPVWDAFMGMNSSLLGDPAEAVLLPGMRDTFGFESSEWKIQMEHASNSFPTHQRHAVVNV